MAELGAGVVTTTAPAVLGGYTDSAFDLESHPGPGAYLSSGHEHSLRNGNPRLRAAAAVAANQAALAKPVGALQSFPKLLQLDSSPVSLPGGPASLLTSASMPPVGSLSAVPFSSSYLSDVLPAPAPPSSGADSVCRATAASASAPPSHAPFGACDGASTLSRGAMTRGTSTTMAASNTSSTSAPAGLWRTGTAGTSGCAPATDSLGEISTVSSNANKPAAHEPASNSAAVAAGAPGVPAVAADAPAPEGATTALHTAVEKPPPPRASAPRADDGAVAAPMAANAEQCSSVIRQIKDIRHHYTLGRKLGSGYTASVYEAKCVATDQIVAIKDVDKTRQRLIASDTYYRAVYETLAKLPPNRHLLLPPIALLETETHFHVVMERCHGSDMVEYVLKHPPAGISSSACRRLMQQLLLAIYVLHSHNVLHRDIKLDNIMFRYPHVEPAQQKSRSSGGSSGLDNEVALIDFDMCLLLDRPDPPKPLLNANEISVVGTREYMAPECYKGHYSTASDMWSIGVILYVLIDGHFPFDVNNCTKQQNASGSKQGGGTTNDADKTSTSSRDIRRLLRQGVRFEQRIKDRHPLAVDLIQRLLTYDPTVRLSSAYEALCHPWLSSVAPPMPRAGAPTLALLPGALLPRQGLPASDPSAHAHKVAKLHTARTQLRFAGGSTGSHVAAPVAGCAGPGASAGDSAEGRLAYDVRGESNAFYEARMSSGRSSAVGAATRQAGLAHAGNPTATLRTVLALGGGEDSKASHSNAATPSGLTRPSNAALQHKHLAAAAMLLRNPGQLPAPLAAECEPAQLFIDSANDMVAEFASASPSSVRQAPMYAGGDWAVPLPQVAAHRHRRGEQVAYSAGLASTGESHSRTWPPEALGAGSAVGFFLPRAFEPAREAARDVHGHPKCLQQLGGFEGAQTLRGVAPPDLRLFLPELGDAQALSHPAAVPSPHSLQSSAAHGGAADWRTLLAMQRASFQRGQTPEDSTTASAATSSPHFFSSPLAVLGLMGAACGETASATRSSWRTKTSAPAPPPYAPEHAAAVQECVDASYGGLGAAAKSLAAAGAWTSSHAAAVGRLVRVPSHQREQPQSGGRAPFAGGSSGIPSLNYLQGPAPLCHIPPPQPKPGEPANAGTRLTVAAPRQQTQDAGLGELEKKRQASAKLGGLSTDAAASLAANYAAVPHGLQQQGPYRTRQTTRRFLLAGGGADVAAVQGGGLGAVAYSAEAH